MLAVGLNSVVKFILFLRHKRCKIDGVIDFFLYSSENHGDQVTFGRVEVLQEGPERTLCRAMKMKLGL